MGRSSSSRSRSNSSCSGSRSRSRRSRRSRRRSRSRRARSASRSASSKSCGRRLPKAWRGRAGSSSSKRSTKSGEQLWRRLRRVRPRSASREAQRELEDDDMREQRGLEKKLQKMVRENRRREALQTALRLLEGGLKCDPELLVGMLVNAATSPGPEIFAYTLQCAVVAGGLRLTCEEFCKILGIMFFRKAPVPQIRAFLNVALPKDANPVPVIPAGLTAEAEQMFSDERVLPEDCEATSSEEEEEDRSGQPPSAITMQQCKAWPQLNGRYVLYHELCIPGRPVYQKQVAKEDSDCEILEPRNGKDRKRILVYSSDLGWAISKGLKGRWLMTNSREARSPPCLGWQAVKEDGSKVSDPGGFLHKQVGITPRAAPEEPPAQKVQKQTQPGPGGSKADARLAKEALECLDLKQLRGHISCPDPCVAEYFGHFVVLAHLEHLADVSSIKRRRERSSADQLVRWGYALSGLKLLSTFGRKEAGGRQNRILPGWEDTGTEMAALQLPMGSMDMDRMRIRRGDSVTISGTDPLQDKLAEGTISDIRPGTLIVQLRGTFPEDCKEKLWRVDKSANATVYERQMWALLCLNHAAKVQPTVELLTAAPVGMADRWAKQWQTSREAKGRRSRSKSRATKKKKTRRKASSSSKDSEEQQKLKRRKRCSELADAELVEDHREDKQLQARKEVEEVDHMNESQRNAIHASLRQTCTVVQGPPGTGKTSVSVEILHFWAKALRLTPVLATSDSNVAVDNICEGLRARGVKAVRVGRPEKVRSVIEDMTLEAELKRLKEAERERGEDDEESKGSAGTFPGKGGKSGGKFGKGKFGGKGHGEDAGEAAARHFEDRRAQNRQDFELQLKILREAEVICTTTIAAGMDFLARLSNFEAILVDEVAQATELSTVVPLILRGANRLVLVGDHCQLPPAVLSPEAEVRGLSVSVYSRLVQAGGLTPFLLDTQYRSHPKLAEFSSQAFYEGLVKSGIEAEKRPAPMGVPWPNPHCPLAFINVNAQEEMEGDSKANLVEAQMVASVVGKVFQYGELSVGQVGVVTPYVAQVRRLKQLLRPVLPPGADFRLLECASVDNFQGREKDLIIFSAVRSNRAGNVGFLADWRRLNVMLTRARRGLLIFGNSETLKQDPTWEKWLAFAEKHECVVKDLPMPSPSFGKGWQAPLGKGKVKGSWQPPGPLGPPGRNPAAAAQAARAAAEARRVRPPPSLAPTMAPAMQMALAAQEQQMQEHMQQLNQLEAQLQQQQQQLQQQQFQAAQLLFVNPVLAQMQLAQVRQELPELQQRLEQLAAQKQQAAQDAQDASRQYGSQPNCEEQKQIEQLLARELGGM
ncbi:unnamed protein product [Effrenium voratum]|uniref:Uncharacterized protein n=1 Tax=Effrenium voratum TaxID=2562239 RepID=A0AA36MGE2_9DINO|nr:unnamed protein product [Effrenium voratum]